MLLLISSWQRAKSRELQPRISKAHTLALASLLLPCAGLEYFPRYYRPLSDIFVVSSMLSVTRIFDRTANATRGDVGYAANWLTEGHKTSDECPLSAPCRMLVVRLVFR